MAGVDLGGPMMRALILAGVMVAAACTGSPNYWVGYKAPTAPSGEHAYKAALRSMSEHQVAVADKDAEAGLVTSEWFTNDLGNTFRYRVVLDDGHATVNIDCKGDNAGCEDGKRPQGLIATARKIAADIQAAH